LLFLGVALSLSAPSRVSGADGEDRRLQRSFLVVGYLPEYRCASFDPTRARLITDLIFFSIQPLASGELDTSRLVPKALQKLYNIRKAHGTRTLVAIGGWGRSRGFGPMATNPETRRRFVQNLAKYCAEQQLDGADFDWEHPKNRSEEEAYAELVAETKRAFEPKVLVTLTLAPWQDPGAKAYQAADRVHIMAYDHADAQHSTFAHATVDVGAFLKRGVPPEKICLGLPFYGRRLDNHRAEKSYADIVRRYHPPAEVDEVAGFYFNGPRTIQRKTTWAKRNGLGGVMIWELGQDSADESSLLRVVRQASEP
jgi:GH18 family chitinase